MKVLVINGFGHNEIKETQVIPRVGEMVDMFYLPHPTVTNVLHWPSKETLVKLQAENIDIAAIVTVS